jgi:mono/diheme cytochrome c family protein
MYAVSDYLASAKSACFGAALALLALGAPSTAVAQDTELGAELYARYCASCHGTRADGYGPASSALAGLLQVDVPDLTTLAERNEGHFPFLGVIHIIDGRLDVPAHGGTMPLWGQVFALDTEPELGLYGSLVEARGRVLSLALYLQSIQR